MLISLMFPVSSVTPQNVKGHVKGNPKDKPLHAKSSTELKILHKMRISRVDS